MTQRFNLLEKKETVRISLDLFDGPLDLLLHLIQTQHIDIAHIKITEITSQYLEALEILKDMDLDVAGEYLVMAATLILIKSRMLLPVSQNTDPEMEDAEELRKKLIEQLKRYEVFRKAGEHLRSRFEMQSLSFPKGFQDTQEGPIKEWRLEADILDLLSALRDIIKRRKDREMQIVITRQLSLREKMDALSRRLHEKGSLLFSEIFQSCATKLEAIVNFLALLELVRLQEVHLRQRKVFGEIRIFPRQGSDGE